MPGRTGAATVWNGPAVTRSNANEPDPITPRVALTRGGSQGLYNALKESGFAHFSSPLDTEWADGTAANFASLTFTDWNTWAKNFHGGPPGTVGVNAVLHLITDDIYINITFTSWGSFGPYSYQRSTPSAANNPPSVALTSPTNGTILAAPANVLIQASAADSDGSVTNVQFLVGTTVLTNVAAAPFSATAKNLAAGNYTLTAIASDNGGAKATNSVNLSVVTPVPLNLSSLGLTAPANFRFTYPANVGLRYVVQRSTNLNSTNWSTLATNLAGASSVVFTDSNAPASPGFYRVGRLPNP